MISMIIIKQSKFGVKKGKKENRQNQRRDETRVPAEFEKSHSGRYELISNQSTVLHYKKDASLLEQLT